MTDNHHPRGVYLNISFVVGPSTWLIGCAEFLAKYQQRQANKLIADFVSDALAAPHTGPTNAYRNPGRSVFMSFQMVRWRCTHSQVLPAAWKIGRCFGF